MVNSYFYLGAIAVLLAGSAFFSGMETAIFSLSRFRVKTLLFENRPGARAIDQLKKDSRSTLTVILLGNLIVDIAASSIAAILLTQITVAHHIRPAVAFIADSVLMTSLLLLFGEITPKVIAIANPEFFAVRLGGIVSLIVRIFRPFTVLSGFFIDRFVPGRETRAITDDEIRYMLNEARQFGVLDESEERFGYQILKFGKMIVREIMTPRTKTVGIGADADLGQALELIRRTRHSRIGVYDSKGEVIGVLYAKDLFSISGPLADRRVGEIMREPYFVPETKRIDNLLEEFRKKGVHFGVVVDEFGAFSGFVTLEDVLESLFGEIVDEYDTADDLPYRRSSDDAYVFSGDITVNEIRRLLGEQFPGPGRERLSALILDQLGRFPRKGDRFRMGDFEVVVEEIRNRQIRSVRVIKS
jgi:putative hemolysin